ncbi:MAG TPA: hypothetical protein V6C96_00025 [Vampirovibrionales bacterium]
MAVKENKNVNCKQTVTGIIFAGVVVALTAGLIYFLQTSGL